MKSVLSIAGSDSSGGAGIQADIKTIAAHHLFAETAITALTAQNTTGVYGVVDVAPEFVEQQIDVVFGDMRPDSVKIGMVSSPEIVDAIAGALIRNEATNIVADPVMVATSGSQLISDNAVDALVSRLLPLADVITPNIPEAEVLSGMKIGSKNEMLEAARIIAERLSGNEGEADGGDCDDADSTSGRPAILLKGGHGFDGDDADDLLLTPSGEAIWLHGEWIDNPNTHGTGCSLSSAIACGLAKGLDVADACRQAKTYVAGAIAAQLDLGKGSGPMNHFWAYEAPESWF